MNNLVPMKNCPWESKVGLISHRPKIFLFFFFFCFFFSTLCGYFLSVRKWQLPFLNHRWGGGVAGGGGNGRRNYFMTDLHERMLPDRKIEPATVRIPGGGASKRATALGLQIVSSLSKLWWGSKTLQIDKRHFFLSPQYTMAPTPPTPREA